MGILEKLSNFQLFLKHSRKDVFWLLDYLLLLGGTYHSPEGFWRIIFWSIYQLMAVYQYIIQVLMVISNVTRWEDQRSAIWSMMSLLTMTLCYVKQILLWNYRGTIRCLRNFISSSQFSSGDCAFDEEVRDKFSRISQKVAAAALALIFVDQILVSIPSSLRTRWFGIPPWIESYGKGTALTIELLFYSSFSLIWVSKLFCSSVTVAIMLIGLRTELEILVKYYGRLTTLLQLELSLGPIPFHDRYHKSPRIKTLFWNQLKLRTATAIRRHVEILEMLTSLQAAFEKLFFLIYYQCLIVAGAVSYVIIRDQFDLCSVAIVLCTGISIFEYYWWCHLVDTFGDLNETLVKHLLNQCCQLPYSCDQHAEYAETRTVFRIVAQVARNSVRFSCCGVFKISTAVFIKLINISYSVLMFLINVYD